MARANAGVVKQVSQTARDGTVTVVDVPVPSLRPGCLLVATRFSLISAGTERTKIVTGEKNLLQKARARPDLVKKVVDRARVEGVRSAVGVARDRLNALTPIGYSAAGVVLEVGGGVEGLAPGDRVACGGEAANHAEILAVPKNLVARVPDGVSFEDAAYATVGAIALHGVRQAGTALGETVGVIGLGLVGQLAVRLLAASGCRVVGVDLDDAAVELACGEGVTALCRDEAGLEYAVSAATEGLGLDAALLCASSSSPDPLELAVRLTRDRGRIVVVGETTISVDRAPMYDKEIELRMSRSYGPGRYDRDYEEHGRDLPPSYVRWTEQRNMQAFLELVAEGRVKPGELTTHRFPVNDAPQAYALLTGKEAGRRPFGVVLEYAARPPVAAPPAPRRAARAAGGAGVALVGAGAFARATLIPALRDASARLVSVTSAGGLTAADVATRFGFERAAASVDEILEDDSIGAVVIATRHASHAGLAAAALHAGKAVFVEKPLALSTEQLQEVEEALAPASVLMVGFNRRFAPLFTRLDQELRGAHDLSIAIRVNAGPLPAGHWLHDPEDGGGRLLGEGCHFVDLLATLAGSEALVAQATAVPQPGRPIECSDSFSANVRFVGGVGTLVYSGAGDTRLPKERIEAFGSGMAAVLDDFRRLDIYRGGKQQTVKGRQDKGHRSQIRRFLDAAGGVAEPPPVAGYLHSTRATLALVTSLQTGEPVRLTRARVETPG
jgi:predicted dehydrogenase/threonine dehydrogenase-like Zn-dependent dehydrogenase